MKTITYDLPNMYGDHHVMEVRRILLELDGVLEVYASSAFRAVEVAYDPAVTNDLVIAMKLDEGGYLGEWSMPMESGVAPVFQEQARPFFRHTATYESTRQVVSFTQNVPYSGKPLWNCPGMGVIKTSMEE